MADEEPAGRPSFAAFWKRSREKLTRGKKPEPTPTPEGTDEPSAAAGPGPGPGPDDGADQTAARARTEQEKALVRRQQVRRAQIQHRQRKANYVKQLELDVSQLRDLITLAEHEGRALRKQNDEIRALLQSAGVDAAPSLRQAVEDALEAMRVGRPAPPVQSASASPSAAGPDADAVPEMFGDINVDDLTVTLSISDTMGTPCFQIGSASGSGSGSGPGSPSAVAEEHKAINFILALEHVCWDHFALGDFHTHSHTSDEERGHSLMASAYCMAAAPESVYTDRAVLTWARSRSRSLSRLRRPDPPLPPTALQWQASGISLDSLHGLAQSLNPGDKEVTPVQAWFELAARFPQALLVGPQALDALLAEFRGVVKCVAFGAAMERMAFESVVARVLGPWAAERA